MRLLYTYCAFQISNMRKGCLGKNNANSVDGNVAHHASASRQFRTVGGGVGEEPEARCCLSPYETRPFAKQKGQVCPIANRARRLSPSQTAKRVNEQLRPGPRMGGS